MTLKTPTPSATPGPATWDVTYTVDGVTVSKSVWHQPLTVDNYAGAYIGTNAYRYTCPDSKVDVNGPITITQTADSASVVLPMKSGTCRIDGSYSQKGRAGRIDGKYTCTDGASGVATLGEMTGRPRMFNAALSLYDGKCVTEGNVVGILPY